MVNVERINITDINPAEYNPRVISPEEYNSLQLSIEEFGFVDPIIINLKNNRIIGGHQRYDIIFSQYLDNGDFDELNIVRLGEIGWVFPDEELEVKSDDHEKALNIALNKISGKWDNAKLDTLLEDIDVENFNVSKIGFDTDEREILKFKIEEQGIKKTASRSQKIESGETVMFRMGIYKIKIPYHEYLSWKDEVEKEAEEEGMIVEMLLLKRLELDKVEGEEENE